MLTLTTLSNLRPTQLRTYRFTHVNARAADPLRAAKRCDLRRHVLDFSRFFPSIFVVAIYTTKIRDFHERSSHVIRNNRARHLPN